MTNGELIAELQQHDRDLIVLLPDACQVNIVEEKSGALFLTPGMKISKSKVESRED